MAVTVYTGISSWERKLPHATFQNMCFGEEDLDDRLYDILTSESEEADDWKYVLSKIKNPEFKEFLIRLEHAVSIKQKEIKIKQENGEKWFLLTDEALFGGWLNYFAKIFTYVHKQNGVKEISANIGCFQIKY